ncbi:MAG TPA: DUF4349 domain-containing protein [Bacillota bacterium]|jgi:hypothetical protein|nr:DUF4349 domain-containing protein [Fastidiosipila sp.]HPX93902.1 DUF4349 domain-containing protein [Bacillota bacterium]HQB81798.1 DUF4349 domain-containing protein [Bacillota bacterium]
MKKRIRLIVLVTALLLVALIGFGCAAGQGAKDTAPREPESWRPGDEWGEDGEYPGILPDEPPLPLPLPPGKIERKFIQNGELALRSSDLKKTYESLVKLTRELGGRVVSYEQLTSGDVAWITMQVAVPFGKLPEFMEHTAENVTKVENKTVTSEEVTEAYYDTKTRIQSTEELIAHYRTMLVKAETIEDTLMVQSRIDELTLELESLKGRLQRLDSLTRESRIDITIRMETDPTITKPEVTWKTLKWSDVGFLMKNAVQRVGIGIVLALQYLLVILVYAAPFILLAALVLLIIWLVRRRRKKRRAKKAAAGSPARPEPPARE